MNSLDNYPEWSETMTYEQWVAKFKPTYNHLVRDASFEGMMFETYGNELDFVLQVVNKGGKLLVWTYIDGDNGTYIVEGYRLVNRIGYFICDVPFEESTAYEVEVSKDDDTELWYKPRHVSKDAQ